MTTTRQSSMTPSRRLARGLGPFEYLQSRGYVQDVSDPDGLRQAFADGVVTAYVGFDPTAPSLHVGNMLGMMMLASLQRFGTGRSRSAAAGPRWLATLGQDLDQGYLSEGDSLQLKRSCRSSSATSISKATDGATIPAFCSSNADWLLSLRYIPFLRDIGRHFSVNEMLARRRTAPGWRRPGSTSWSSTTGWCRPTTSSTSSAPRAARCRWVAPTSGATSSPASS